MAEKEITWDNLEDSFFGEDDLFGEKIFKKGDLIEDLFEEDEEESEE